MDMRADPQSLNSSSPSKLQQRVGVGLAVLPVLFLVVDGAMKLAQAQVVVDSAPALGLPVSVLAPLGAVLLVCTALYVVPKTSLLGAILLTGYFGGAMAIHVRIENPLFSHVLFPVYLAAFLWGSLLLREPRLRQLLPLR